MDWEFLALSSPQKRGEWEIDLPADAFGNLRSGVLRAWAMDFRRHVLYRLPGDQEFTVGYENSRPRACGRRNSTHSALKSNATAPQISIVVPFFNEEENVAPLLAEIRAVCDAIGKTYEGIFVNDGSHGRHRTKAR